MVAELAKLAESAYGGGGTLTTPELEHIFMSYLGVISVHVTRTVFMVHVVSVHDHHVSVHFNTI